MVSLDGMTGILSTCHEFTSGSPTDLRDAVVVIVTASVFQGLEFGGERWSWSWLLNQTQAGLMICWGEGGGGGGGDGWTEQVVPTPSSAAIGWREPSVTLSCSVWRLQSVGETRAASQTQACVA